MGINLTFIAAQSNNVNLVDYLIRQHRVDWKLKNEEGYNTAWIAAFQGRVEVMEYLIALDANFLEQDQDKNGNTLLHLACQLGYQALSKLLLQSFPHWLNQTRKLVSLQSSSDKMLIDKFLLFFRIIIRHWLLQFYIINMISLSGFVVIIPLLIFS